MISCKLWVLPLVCTQIRAWGVLRAPEAPTEKQIAPGPPSDRTKQYFRFPVIHTAPHPARTKIGNDRPTNPRNDRPQILVAVQLYLPVFGML